MLWLTEIDAYLKRAVDGGAGVNGLCEATAMPCTDVDGAVNGEGVGEAKWCARW